MSRDLATSPGRSQEHQIMHVATLHAGRTAYVLAFFVSLFGVSLAHADTLNILWDPNQGTVNGYAVYVGSSRIDVGNTTSYTMTTAVAGQRYCFAVAAYNTKGEGPKSGQVCGYSNEFPTLTSPGNQSSKVGQVISLQLAGKDPDGMPITYTATGLPPGLFVGSATGFISGTLTKAGNYSVTARVSDGVLQSNPLTFAWSVTTGSTSSDTTRPSASIATPTVATSFTATTASLSLGGTAADNVGVASVTWSNSRGGSGTASGTTTWSVPSIGLQTGSNVITITAHDAAGNIGADSLTVTYNAPSADTTAPAVTISGPTSATTYTATSSPLTLSGTASDNVGVAQVSWVTDRGASGTASGTTNWTAAGITLQGGTNIVTVTARDAAGNTKTDVLTVTYQVATSDTTPPTISIAGPTTGSTWSTKTAVVTLGGTASDNRGVTAVTWTNNRGGSGFSSGTTSWSVPSVPLQGGTNVITVTAQDAAGNKGTDVLTVTYTATTTTTPPPTQSTSAVLTGQLLRSGTWVRASLQWSNLSGTTAGVWFNGKWLSSTANDGDQVFTPTGNAPYSYKVCYGESSTNCSNTIVLN
jgi:hypothetical protein